jgi:predicted Rossmann fold flavoprotein
MRARPNVMPTCHLCAARCNDVQTRSNMDMTRPAMRACCDTPARLLWRVARHAPATRALRPLCSSAQQQQRKVLVVGGGAAGLTAAYFAARAGAAVTVLERNGEAGKKILMSGGTRANVLPLALDPARDFFTSSSPNALRRVLLSWPLADMHAWLEKEVGVPLQLEEETSKWFPRSASGGREVRDKLVAACTRAGARVVFRASMERLERVDGHWAVTCADGAQHAADAVVISTGGLSFPAVGTDGTGHRLVKGALGHSLQAVFPALVPLLGAHPGGGAALAGVSIQTVALRYGLGAKAPTAHRGGFLFTHRGYSGPSVLDMSHRFVTATGETASTPLVANWTGESAAVWSERLGAPGPHLVLSRVTSAGVPARLAAALCAAAEVPPDRKAAELRKEERQRLLAALTEFQLPVGGDAGFTKAEVTGGGVPLAEVRLDTLESRLAPGVFLAGEVLDAFGRIGGFNFTWAWASGRLAGLGAAGDEKAPS